jgi:hypothetical protein
MNGDFSRDTFHPAHRYSRVLMQQGRVLLDADWNEQTSILLHQLRALARDLIGPHGGPGEGFRILCPAHADTPPAEEAVGEDRERDEEEARLEEEAARREEERARLEEEARARRAEEPPLGEEAARGQGTSAPSARGPCDFAIGFGHYYVDGILVENLPEPRCGQGGEPRPVTYRRQPDYPLGPDDRLREGRRYLVYLDVWERHETHLHAPGIREPALGGPDTSTRARVVWQVKVADESRCEPWEGASCDEILGRLVAESPRCLRARARVPDTGEDPCIIRPDARYRGAENQLYRVQIHQGGEAGSHGGSHGATFTWSRDNGSVVFGIRSLQGQIAELDTLGPDTARTLHEGDWVEVLDDGMELRGEPGVMARVDAVDRVRFQVTLAPAQGSELPPFRPARTPLLRRWEQGSEALPVREGKWIDLEDGVQVHFEPGGRYRTGDHWLIPARAATGDVLWPLEEEASGAVPRALPPRGPRHHHAPLARIRVDQEGRVHCEHDCRCVLRPPCPRARGEVPVPERPTSPTGPTPSPADPPTGTVVGAVLSTPERERLVEEFRVVEGVGRVRANRFIDAGLRNAAEVAELPPERIREILEVSDTLAVSIRESALGVTGLRP